MALQGSGSKKGPSQPKDVFYPEDAMNGRFSLIYDGGPVAQQTVYGAAVKAPTHAGAGPRVYIPRQHIAQCLKELGAGSSSSARPSTATTDIPQSEPIPIPGTGRGRTRTSPEAERHFTPSPAQSPKPTDAKRAESPGPIFKMEFDDDNGSDGGDNAK